MHIAANREWTQPSTGIFYWQETDIIYYRENYGADADGHRGELRDTFDYSLERGNWAKIPSIDDMTEEDKLSFSAHKSTEDWVRDEFQKGRD